MLRASQPHTPDVDLVAYRAHAAKRGTGVLLTPDLEAFCQGGVSVIVAAAAPGEAPIASLGCGCRFLPDGRMRLLLLADAGEAVIALARRGCRIAATFSQPFTHRSIQLKGSCTGLAEATDADREAAVSQMHGLALELVDADHGEGFSEAYCHIEPAEVVALDIALESAFVQTPGPGAGAELTP